MENLNKSFEPMDVDLSAQSTSAMDISETHSGIQTQIYELDEDCCIVSSSTPTRDKSPVPCPIQTTEPNNLKKYHINVHSQTKKIAIESKIKVMTFVFVVLVSIAIYQCRIQCYKELELEHLRYTLSSQVFGQAKAIDSIIGAFEEDKKYKVLFFYGGTGVGKTYTSSLIMNNLGPSSNLYHYTMPTFVEAFSSDIMLGLIMCDSSVIVIDDLSVNTNVSKQINDIIAKSYNLQNNLTIILIHNCASTDDMFHKKCDESLQSILLKTYYNAHALFYFIKFESLTDSDLRKCIDRELGEVKLDKPSYEKLFKNFDVTLDGCKGVHTKVKLLNMI